MDGPQTQRRPEGTGRRPHDSRGGEVEAHHTVGAGIRAGADYGYHCSDRLTGPQVRALADIIADRWRPAFDSLAWLLHSDAPEDADAADLDPRARAVIAEHSPDGAAVPHDTFYADLLARYDDDLDAALCKVANAGSDERGAA